MPDSDKNLRRLEAENDRLRSVIYDVAHTAATLGSGSDGWLRGRFMSISNALNAAIGRGQSSHGDQYDAAGNLVRPDPLNGVPAHYCKRCEMPPHNCLCSHDD